MRLSLSVNRISLDSATRPICFMQISWSVSKATCQLFSSRFVGRLVELSPLTSNCDPEGHVRPVLRKIVSMINLSGTSAARHRLSSIKNRQHQRGADRHETGRCNTKKNSLRDAYCWTLKKRNKKETKSSCSVCSRFYKAWQIAWLLNCVHWCVWSIWNNHLQLWVVTDVACLLLKKRHAQSKR